MRLAEVVELEGWLLPLVIPRTSAQTLKGIVSMLHLYRHVHTGVMDDQACEVIERPATQHGEIFTYLNKKIAHLLESKL